MVRSPETDLLKVIEDHIYMRGPISVAEYMRIALLHPQFGYYCRSDAFGTHGDFTTAPEISQLFGEMIGIWCLSMWIDLGKPPSINLIELGPGRGTLIADLLRVCKQFQNFETLSVLASLSVVRCYEIRSVKNWRCRCERNTK